MIRRLTSAPKPAAARLEVVGDVVGAGQAHRAAVAHAVVAGEVGRRFGRRDDVVGRQPVVGMGQVDIDDLGPGGLQRRHGLADARLHARLHALDEVLPRQPQPHAAQPGGGLVV